MNNFTSVLTIINFAVVIGGAIGLYIALRSTLAKLAGEIQDRVRQGLLDENELLRTRVKHLEEEVEYLKGVHETTSDLLQQKGFTLTIEGDTVTLEGDGKVNSIRKRARPIKPVLKATPKKETP